MHHTKLIGLCGQAGSGKTTVSNYLKSRGFEIVSFATPLKKAVSILFGFDYEILLGETQDMRELRETTKDPIWGMSGREALQKIGTEIFRNQFDQDIWVKIAKREIVKLLNEGKNIVVSDVRFQNEYEMINKLNGIFYYIERPINQTGAKSDQKGAKSDQHESERVEFLKKYAQSIINNDQGFEELYKKINDLIKLE